MVSLCPVVVFFHYASISLPVIYLFSALSNGLPALCDLTLSANQGNGVVTLTVEELVENKIHFL